MKELQSRQTWALNMCRFPSWWETARGRLSFGQSSYILFSNCYIVTSLRFLRSYFSNNVGLRLHRPLTNPLSFTYFPESSFASTRVGCWLRFPSLFFSLAWNSLAYPEWATELEYRKEAPLLYCLETPLWTRIVELGHDRFLISG